MTGNRYKRAIFKRSKKGVRNIPIKVTRDIVRRVHKYGSIRIGFIILF